MPRNPVDKCNITWENRYGTTISGNLSQYNRTKCIEDIIDLDTVHSGGADWVTIYDFHYYHIKCPYSNEAEVHYVLNTDRNSPNFWKVEEVPVSGRADHTATSGIMIRHVKGNKYGWLCVDPNCPFFINNGQRYFYR